MAWWCWRLRNRTSEALPGRDVDQERAVIERQRLQLRAELGWRDPDLTEIPLSCEHDHPDAPISGGPAVRDLRALGWWRR
jgi:hypothetical protein